MIKLLYVFLFLFLLPQQVSASTPVLNNPENNSATTDTSPKLSWDKTSDCPITGNCYLIEVSKSTDFSELEKSTYTNNTYYSPTLSEGSWFWRVKAKDQNNNWSEYSEVRTLNINNEVKPSSSPIPTINPTQSPIPTPIAQGGNTEKEKQSFTISLDKNSIDSKEIVEIQVKLNNFTPNSVYFIKPSFFKEGSTNYFGLLELNNSWIKNSVTATSQYKINTDFKGNWNGKINTKVDIEDSGFNGRGNYQLKVGRYTEAGSGLIWSNNVTISIAHTEVLVEAKSSPTPVPSDETILDEQSEIEIEVENHEENIMGESTSSADINYQIATISGVEKTNIPDDKTLVKGSYQLNWWFISSGLLVMVITSLYVVHQRKRMYHA